MNRHTILLQNPLENWARALALVLALWFLFWIVRKLSAKYLERVAEKHHNAFYETLSDLTRRTKLQFLLVLALSVALRPLTLPPGFERGLDKLLIISLVIQFALWGGAFLSHFVEPYLTRNMGLSSGQGSTIAAVSFLLRLVLFALLAIWGLDNLGVNVSALVAGLGVGGVAVALATQNILGDLFASLSITLDKPFQVGDSVTVGTFQGTVEKVGLKTTRMRSVSGEQLIFSNADLLASRLINNKRMIEKRTLILIGVTYDTSPANLRKIPEILEKACADVDRIRFDRANLVNLNLSSLDFEFVFWMKVLPADGHLKFQQQVFFKIIDAFAAEGIQFAYPTQTVFVNQAAKNPGT